MSIDNIGSNHGLSIHTTADGTIGAATADNRRRRPVPQEGGIIVYNTFNDATFGDFYGHAAGYNGIDFIGYHDSQRTGRSDRKAHCPVCALCARGPAGLGAGGSVSGYEAVDFRTVMDASNEAVTIISQIESQEGLDNLEEIAEAGTDVLWVGQADLSQSLGIPGEFGHPRFKAALTQVVDCAKVHGLGAGIQPTDEKQMMEWRDAGFNVISYSVDTAVYAAALAAGRDVVRDTEGAKT